MPILDEISWSNFLKKMKTVKKKSIDFSMQVKTMKKIIEKSKNINNKY